ncbi:MAG TPA: Ig-like domain-containing protein [Gemmatimonas sp.]|uniref:Ig-like domain-containing protein n=1 Tax=Gemmatimonas sp. TaxID=1962908 RepID=UPI002ED819E4
MTSANSLSMQVGDSYTLQLTTALRRSRTVTWRSTSSSIAGVSSSGTVRAYRTGTVTVTASGSGMSESFTVAVAAAPVTPTPTTPTTPTPGPTPVVTNFEISPATGAALAPGNVRQFSTTAIWSDGASRAVTVNYSAVGGTINTNGLFTAGSIGGTFLVIANCTCGMADTAQVQVNVPVTVAVQELRTWPRSVTMRAGATQEFWASAVWTNGATTLPPLTWAATGGSLASNLIYTAPSAPGRYLIVATHMGGTLKDTSVVVVEAAAAQLTKLTIAPKVVSLTAGASQQFATTANWSTGATDLPPVTYSATGGSVSSTGAYVAPTTAGTYRVIVAHTGGTVRDTATVTVIENNNNSTTNTPSAGGPTLSGGGANEPSGYATIFSNPMSTLPPKHPLKDAYGFRNFFGTNYLAVQTEGAATYMRATFPKGTGGGADYPNAFASLDWGSVTTGMTKMYMRLRVRLSSNWTDNGNTGTKFFFFLQQQGNNHYIGMTNGGLFQPMLGLQSTFGYGTPSGPNHYTPSPLSKGDWHELEVLVEANTPGQYNGKYRMWVDGQLLVTRTDVGYFAAGQVVKFEEMYFNPTYGGGYNPVPADQSIDIDHWYMSLGR